ncbi:MAG: hypothetical protein ABJB22_04785, partial [Verrucomicrobiota bacterium]
MFRFAQHDNREKNGFLDSFMGESLRPPFIKSLAVSAGLSGLFLVVYGGCNWITSQRSDVGLLSFEWERHIPFVPLLIVP